METHEKIIQQSQSLARLERALALQKVKKRKAETRRKIELGGLVVKAKMDELPKDIILGALLKAKEALQKEEGARLLYQSIGEAAFMEYVE